MRRSAALAMLAVMAVAVVSADARGPWQRSAYTTQGTCAGVPGLPSLRVAPGFCAGLAATRLGMPRGVVALGPHHLLVTDLGAWEPNRGRLLALTRDDEQASFKVTVLLQGLDRPHGIRRDPQGRILVAEAGRISVLDTTAGRPQLRPLVEGLPIEGRHPLKQFAVGPEGSLYVNVGASSDHCEAEGAGPAGTTPAPVRPRCEAAEGAAPVAAIWKFTPHGDAPGPWERTVVARGLRNSMALAWHPTTGELWQAENSRDVLPGGTYAAQQPADELNRVVAGQHYGWPYCTGQDIADAAFADSGCPRYTAPVRLLPAHVAPLGMTFYPASPRAPAAWRDALVMAWHGYAKPGHRVVGLRFTPDGRQPVGAPMDLVAGWGAVSGQHPMGTPTDVTADDAGHLWVTEDHNGTLIVVAPVRRGGGPASP